MPTSNERKALTFLAIVALSGTAVRLVRAHSTGAVIVPRDSLALDRQLERVDSARRRRPAVVPKAPDSTPVDLDLANAVAIEALPGVGASLARRIVANRDSIGAFGGVEALCDVTGIGPALAERLRPLVTFSGAPRPLSDGCGDASNAREKRHSARRRNKR